MGTPMDAFTYASGTAPPQYKCDDCGARGVKLWREYQTFAGHTKLLCAACACANQGKPDDVDDAGRRDSGHGHTDSIGWLVPAVPTVKGDTFWGYTSVPADGVAWWRALPTRADARRSPR